MLGIIVMISAIVASIATIVGTIAFFMEKQENYKIQTYNKGETVSKIKLNTDGKIEELEENNESRHNQIIARLGLSKNSEKVLKSLLGANYEEILSDRETFNQLLQDIENRTITQIVDENKELKRMVQEYDFIKNSEIKNKIVDLLSKFRYESARKIIDTYIRENKNLEPEYLAELYNLKALTFSGKDKNYLKRKEFFQKAMDLDQNNPNILGAYGKFLNYSGQSKEASKFLKRALELIDIGKHIQLLENVEILVTLGNTLFLIEMGKPKWERDFTSTEYYLERAITVNSQLSEQNSQLYKIQKNLAEIEINKERYDEAIKLSHNSIQNELQTKGNNISAYSAFSYDNLGKCYTMKFINGQDFYQKGMSAFNRALELFKELEGENDIHVADTYNNLGNLVRQKDLDKAIEYYKKSIGIAKSNEIVYSKKLGGSYANLARIYGKKKMRREAIYNAEEALFFFRKELPENHEEILLLKELITYMKDL